MKKKTAFKTTYKSLKSWFVESAPMLFAGVSMTFFLAWLSIAQLPYIHSWLESMSNMAYDVRLRHATSSQLLKPQSPIVIVDIDDDSLAKQGRWPWSRSKIAKLISKIKDHGAVVVGLDIVFPEPEVSVVEAFQKKASEENIKIPDQFESFFSQIKEHFDVDQILVKSLRQLDSVPGFVFDMTGIETRGMLPAPLQFEDHQDIFFQEIPTAKGYLGNIAIIQQNIPHGGFINAIPDADGILRQTNLFIKYQGQIYPSLGVEVARLYLLSEMLKVKSDSKKSILEGVFIDSKLIPTDPEGRIYIPYRGKAGSFPYVSATDVLEGRLSSKFLEGKIVLIGTSATGMGDLKSTPVAPVYPGVEVHATIIDGILNNRIYYHPSWASDMIVWLTVGIGGIISVLWVALSVRELVLGTVFLTALLFFLNQYLWSAYHYVLSFLMPIILVWFIFLMNLGHGYWRESRKKSQLKSMFGQYVPPQHVEKMLTDPSVYDLEGESREMTVLFADIRNFTSLTEKMTAAELKRILNDYLTPMTKIIFDHDGTIDKYVGDMIMAFWGAPLEDPDHAKKAIRAALAMQKELKHRGEFKLKNGEIIQINIGIGLNTGIMNVGDMGSSYRRAYTVLGDAVNLGSRLEASSKFYGAKILVGEKTREGQTEFLFRLADKVRVKGKLEAIQAYEPLCFMSEASPELITNIARYHEGIELYYRQQWDEAEKIMEDLSKIYPPIKIYKIYLERIRSFRQSPPGSDWDGVFIREEK